MWWWWPSNDDTSTCDACPDLHSASTRPPTEPAATRLLFARTLSVMRKSHQAKPHRVLDHAASMKGVTKAVRGPVRPACLDVVFVTLPRAMMFSHLYHLHLGHAPKHFAHVPDIFCCYQGRQVANPERCIGPARRTANTRKGPCTFCATACTPTGTELPTSCRVPTLPGSVTHCLAQLHLQRELKAHWAPRWQAQLVLGPSPV